MVAAAVLTASRLDLIGNHVEICLYVHNKICAFSCSHRVLLSSVLLSGRPHPLVALPRGSLYALVADVVLVVFRSLLSSALLVRWFGCSLAHPLPALFSSVLSSPS